MTEEMALGALSRQDLAGMKEEAMKARYGVSRDTARKARAKALATLPVLGLETSTNSDK
jgi:hypothetical protein